MNSHLFVIALIENITAVPDFSTNPEGLPNVSLLIQTSHRQLKLTAPSMEKHDDWFEVIWPSYIFFFFEFYTN